MVIFNCLIVAFVFWQVLSCIHQEKKNSEVYPRLIFFSVAIYNSISIFHVHLFSLFLARLISKFLWMFLNIIAKFIKSKNCGNLEYIYIFKTICNILQTFQCGHIYEIFQIFLLNIILKISLFNSHFFFLQSAFIDFQLAY